MKTILKKYWAEILLGLMIVLYVSYFSYFSILRYQTLYSHYFDLGIMNQTVYNTFMAIKTGDISRFLEMTNPHGFDQVKRMAVHNDIFLALLAPFYFIFSGPETLLVIQTIAVALGSIALFCIGKIVFDKNRNARGISLFFAFTYLMYPPLQRANQFDFHAVVLATPLLLFMYYFYLKKKYWMSGVLAVLAVLTKEQVGLTVACFGIIVIFQNMRTLSVERRTKDYIFAAILFFFGVGWFLMSMTKVIPYFRSGAHFALEYFGDFGDSPTGVLGGLIKNPQLVFTYILRKDTYEYLFNILGPLSFFPLLSPLHLFIAAPEFGINLISKSGAMRNIYFHYTAVITPFIFISALYGLRRVKRYRMPLLILCMACAVYFSATQSPLPYSARSEMMPFTTPKVERVDVYIWQQKLSDDAIKVMATGSIAPLFSSRRYLYYYSERYDLADYVVLSIEEAYNSYGSMNGDKIYMHLQNDVRFAQIYKNNSFEVYKKL